jgi:hypothetical protein
VLGKTRPAIAGHERARRDIRVRSTAEMRNTLVDQQEYRGCGHFKDPAPITEAIRSPDGFTPRASTDLRSFSDSFEAFTCIHHYSLSLLRGQAIKPVLDVKFITHKSDIFIEK